MGKEAVAMAGGLLVEGRGRSIWLVRRLSEGITDDGVMLWNGMKGLSAFGSLKALNLSGNSIVRIAAGLRDLTRLRVLDLSYNRVLRIGHGLGACSSIKELYLAGNKISRSLQLITTPCMPLVQKNVGDKQLKKYVLSLLPHLTYYNRSTVHQSRNNKGLSRPFWNPRLRGREHLLPAIAGKVKLGSRQNQQGAVMTRGEISSFPRSRSEGNLGVL
ncbi:Outer arm dynein light chain 1 protein [Salvia divinorum]|uniref:Outer arm dynein light chain 1 protein n=1 Tax=Salvia divinorum TaxID=28513 RepID=A0ABD1I123_SALDI